MKLHQGILLIVCVSLLSNCAYIEGRKEQAAANNNKPLTGHVINAPASKSVGMPQANPSQTASKMIAPIVQ